jgi:hypothetical protein
MAIGKEFLKRGNEKPPRSQTEHGAPDDAFDLTYVAWDKARLYSILGEDFDYFFIGQRGVAPKVSVHPTSLNLEE